MMPVVWSERTELHDATGAEHDCAYSAILDCLIWGGKVSYTRGIYTPEEREALERSDAQPDETGASSADIDVAIKTRYGLAAHIPATLSEAWQVGHAISVGGRLANFPAGHSLRRWDPEYTGGHRVCVVVLSATTARWLDPLAPWKYVGDTVSLMAVQTFIGARLASDLRYVKENEYGLSGGIGGGIDIMGLQTELGNPPIVGKLAIPQGTDSIRVSDGQHYKTTVATSRDAVTAALQGAQTESGFLVDLIGLGPDAEQHFIRGSAPVSFVPAAPPNTPVAIPLAPGLYEVKA